MYIDWIDYMLPTEIVSNTEIEMLQPDWNVKLAEPRTGVLFRNWFPSTYSAVDLAVEIIKKHGDIPDTIIYCTQTPCKDLPGDSFMLHGMLKLPNTVKLYDYQSACNGFIGGLSLARGMLLSREATKIMLVTAESYSKRMEWDDSQRESRLLFGDGVAVTYLKQNWYFAPRSLGKITMYSDGNGYDYFYGDSAGLHMEGKAILEFVMREVPSLINTILFDCGYIIDDIDLFVFHQASKVTLDFLNKKLKIPKEKQFTNLEYIGNTVSASIPIALKDAELQGRLHEGMKVLIAGFGSGLSWGGTIIEW